MAEAGNASNASASAIPNSLILGASSLYITTGSFIISTNGLTMAVVLMDNELRRKEYFITAGLAFADLLTGCGCLGADIHRLQLYFRGEANELVPQWSCTLHLFMIGLLIGPEMSSLMMVYVSIDRLVATTKLAYYMKLGKSYVYKVIGVIWAYCGLALTVAVGSSYYTGRDVLFPAVCMVNDSVPKWFGEYHFFQQFTCGIISIGVYFAILRAMRKDTENQQHDAIKQKYLERQRRVTNMLLIVISTGFLLHDIPNFVLLILVALRSRYIALVGAVCWSLVSISLANNIVIYIFKNKEMRDAVKRLFGLGSGNAVVPLAANQNNIGMVNKKNGGSGTSTTQSAA